jgi:hypothetical protein
MWATIGYALLTPDLLERPIMTDPQPKNPRWEATKDVFWLFVGVVNIVLMPIIVTSLVLGNVGEDWSEPIGGDGRAANWSVGGVIVVSVFGWLMSIFTVAVVGSRVLRLIRDRKDARPKAS